MVPVLLGRAAHHQKVAIAKGVLAHGRPVIDAVAAAAAATTTAAGDAVAAADTAAAADAGPYIEHAAELELAGRAERQRPDRRRRPEEGAPVSVVPARRQQGRVATRGQARARGRAAAHAISSAPSKYRRRRIALNGRPRSPWTRVTSGCSHGGTGTYGAKCSKPPKKAVQHGVSHALPKRADVYATRCQRVWLVSARHHSAAPASSR